MSIYIEQRGGTELWFFTTPPPNNWRRNGIWLLAHLILNTGALLNHSTWAISLFVKSTVAGDGYTKLCCFRIFQYRSFHIEYIEASIWLSTFSSAIRIFWDTRLVFFYECSVDSSLLINSTVIDAVNILQHEWGYQHSVVFKCTTKIISCKRFCIILYVLYVHASSNSAGGIYVSWCDVLCITLNSEVIDGWWVWMQQCSNVKPVCIM